MTEENTRTLMRIQNSEEPGQFIELNWDPETQSFETKGLRELFDIKEIRIRPEHILSNLEEYAWILHWLLESMSTAKDLNIPFTYQSPFTIGNRSYELKDEGEYVSLAPVESTEKVLH
ncbi:hypothetical protein [Thermodesulforhabdus norvegica]|uniref:Uncharacterized protein n=1 Tax=Thermodesulforhabdus norvegica TaxID=39841 RepID=A0A1I4U8B7_9BACT|nr:hypothetical protein [Thermodesulforhabdus norvegica]SFM85246.1 hypothetical protein SAMN05660836_01704 [Thermodesulforhabdus norvegica]